MSEKDDKPTGAGSSPIPNLPEPTLDDAKISSDTAKEASLNEAAAEAAKVEAEAKSTVIGDGDTSWLNKAQESSSWDDAFGSIGAGSSRTEQTAQPPIAETPVANSAEHPTPAGDESPDSRSVGTESAGGKWATEAPAEPASVAQPAKAAAESEALEPEKSTPEPEKSAAEPLPTPPTAAQPTTTPALTNEAGLTDETGTSNEAALTSTSTSASAETAQPGSWNQPLAGSQGGFGPNNPQTPQTPQTQQGSGGPFEPGGPQEPGTPGGPGGPFGPDNNSGKGKAKLWMFLGGGVIVLALIALLIWLLISQLGGAESADVGNSSDATVATSDSATPRPSSTDGSVISSDAKPSTWQVGDCIKGYVDINTRADIVSCSTGHSGQLIGTFNYQSGDTYPGETTLKTKGDEYCASIELASSASNYDIRQQYGYPTESTWGKGDRKIDCIAYTKGGEIIKESLLQP